MWRPQYDTMTNPPKDSPRPMRRKTTIEVNASLRTSRPRLLNLSRYRSRFPALARAFLLITLHHFVIQPICAQTTFGPQQSIIANSTLGPRSVYAADLDGDGDIDVLSASQDDDKIAWYENLTPLQNAAEVWPFYQ